MSPLAADVLTQFGLSGDGKWFVGQSRPGEAPPVPTTVKFLVSVNSSNLSKVVRSTTQVDEAGVCAPSLAADAVQGISAVDGTVLWPLLGDAPPLFVAHTIIAPTQPTQPTTGTARTAPVAAVATTTTTAAVTAGTSSQRHRYPDNRPRKGNGWGGRRVKGVSSAKKKNNRDESDDDDESSDSSDDEDEDSKPLATQYLKAAAAPTKRPRETDSTNRRSSRVPHVRGTLDTAHSVVASNHKTTSGTSPATAPGTTTEVSTTTTSGGGGVRPATTLQALLQRAQDERVRMPQS